jgi:hypothetical protein
VDAPIIAPGAPEVPVLARGRREAAQDHGIHGDGQLEEDRITHGGQNREAVQLFEFSFDSTIFSQFCNFRNNNNH